MRPSTFYKRHDSYGGPDGPIIAKSQTSQGPHYRRGHNVYCTGLMGAMRAAMDTGAMADIVATTATTFTILTAALKNC